MSASLSDLPNYVADAFHLVVDPPFVPENIVLGQYTFVPWARSGVGAAVGPPAKGLRATIAVAIAVQADGQAPLTGAPPEPLAVRGPGDVVGIDQGQVIRRYPSPGTTNAEDSFLAHIEFDRPELPWLFTPDAPAGTQLKAWLALVVLAAGRYELTPGAGGLPDRVSTHKGELQPLENELWAWAHAQVIGPVATGPSVAARLSRSYASVNLSRLMCPRHLAPDVEYLACVVPTYDCGKQTGLGTGLPGTLNQAWTRQPDGSDAEDTVVLPVYSSWKFATGPAGDFASLAERLHGVPAPWRVGRRIADVATPGGGLPPLPAADPARLQTVHGPLTSPNSPDPASADPTEAAAGVAETSGWPAAETEALRTLLNLPDVIAARPPDAAHPTVDRPVIGPEIYARYQAAVSRLDAGRDADWLGQINLRPEHRVVAGLGTRVVHKDQEQLMQAAWAQVGAVDAANQQLRRAQLARFSASAAHRRHIAPLSYGNLLAVTRGVHGRVLAAPAVTVAAAVADSAVADAAVTAAFRRVTRPLGGLAAFAVDRRAELARLVADGVTPRDMQRPYRDPDGVSGLSAEAAATLDPTIAAPMLGVTPDAVAAALLVQGAALAAQPSWPDLITPAAVAGATAPPGFDLAVEAGRRLVEALKAILPAKPAADPVRATGLLALLEALQSVGGGVSDEATLVADELRQRFKGDAPADPQLTAIFGAANQGTPGGALAALASIAGDLVSPDWPATIPRPALAVAAPSLVGLLEPSVTVTARIRGRLGALPGWLPPDWFDDLAVQPIMAAPVFNRPMYKALDDYSRDWLLPGLATFPEPDVVSLLVSNGKFIEGFLVGLSHEMGRELLWRGYPTDQRGTYFRRFWDATKDDLSQDVHRFDPTALGKHLPADLENRVVLLVRGELIRRHPDAVVVAMLAGGKDPQGRPTFEDPQNNPTRTVLAPVLFHNLLEPDITLVGFDLTVAQIRGAPTDPPGLPGQGWWFVIGEHPTAPRFGLQETPSGDNLRDGLGWANVDDPAQRPPDLPVQLAGVMAQDRGFLDPKVPKLVRDDPAGVVSPTFGADAASNAHVLLRNPMRAAFEALALINRIGAP